MKPVAYGAALLGLVSAVLGQAVTLAPSPTESVGCEPHGDHWHCEGPRVTSAPVAAATSSSAAAAVTTSSATHDHDHDHGDDDDDDHVHTDAAGTGSLKPSPTESYGCEPHGDHWHCEGPVTASATGTASVSAAASGSTTVVSILVTTTSAPTLPAANASTTRTALPSTAGAPRYEVAGLGFAGLAAVAAMAL
ncbi:hypothetical protein NEMBOFW57_003644 [Staphylotrichum longicolle]|uniref:Uncharacterized protein n=1 Tax=Staphylotrichum longicolle TaxID=669026 RepID=A0AAD4F5C9_9PEZI|nr:hypothetical protein NEMBOFW57_003644 [Staphylotrichum longicolle]